jgi:hypothetical protein
MRHLLTNLAAAVFVVGLGFSQAQAAPLPQPDGPATEASPVETVGYYGYGYRRYGGYNPYHYNYWRHYYGYYRPYRSYGYWNRPYHRRYW